MTDVSIVQCSDYESEYLRHALIEGFAPFGGLGMIKSGMTIAIKNALKCATIGIPISSGGRCAGRLLCVF